jgi:hypothetical protein
LLERSAEAYGASSAAIAAEDTPRPWGLSVRADPAMHRLYFERFAGPGSPWKTLPRRSAPAPGVIFNDRAVVPKEQLRRTAFYNERVDAGGPIPGQ